MVTDLTQGKPAKVLLRFSLPVLASVLFQQLYSICDSVIAGRLINEDALAAVGASYPITMIFMAVAIGCNIGVNVVVSNRFGARQFTEMKSAVSTAFICVLGSSLALTAAGIAGGESLLRLLKTPDNIFADSLAYLQIFVAGLFFMFLYNLCNGIFTALGDSSTSLYFLIGSSLFNIAADVAFVLYTDLGVAGVAWATLISQAIAALLAVTVLAGRLRAVKTEQKPEKFSVKMLGEISKFALPSIAQQSFVSIGNLFIQGVVNSYDSHVLAGYSSAIKLNTFAITVFMAMSNSVSSYSAQNAGAGRLDRIRAGFRSACLIALGISLPFALLYTLLPEFFLGLFLTDDSAVAMQAGRGFVTMVSPFFVMVIYKLMSDGVLRGSGSATLFAVSTFSDLILRVALVYILSPSMGPTGIWLSWPIGWFVGTAVSLAFYFSGCWQRKVVKKE